MGRWRGGRGEELKFIIIIGGSTKSEVLNVTSMWQDNLIKNFKGNKN